MDLTTGLLAAIPGLFRLLLQVGLVIVGATVVRKADAKAGWLVALGGGLALLGTVLGPLLSLGLVRTLAPEEMARTMITTQAALGTLGALGLACLLAGVVVLARTHALAEGGRAPREG